MVSSGVRIGTPALAARGFDLDDFAEVSDVIAAALRPSTGDDELPALGSPGRPTAAPCTPT
jgi:glycine hydroxymethyltransferase